MLLKVSLEFPTRRTKIPAALRIPDERFIPIMQAMIRDRGRFQRGDAAAIVFLSASRFSHTSQTLFGECFRIWQTRVRLAMSALVVVTTFWSMADLAEEFRYSDK